MGRGGKSNYNVSLEIKDFNLEKAKLVSKLLSFNSKITELLLDIKESQIINNDIKTLLQFLDFNKSIRKMNLKLEKNRIDDDGCESILLPLESNTL